MPNRMAVGFPAISRPLMPGKFLSRITMSSGGLPLGEDGRGAVSGL